MAQQPPTGGPFAARLYFERSVFHDQPRSRAVAAQPAPPHPHAGRGLRPRAAGAAGQPAAAAEIRAHRRHQRQGQHRRHAGRHPEGERPAGGLQRLALCGGVPRAVPDERRDDRPRSAGRGDGGGARSGRTAAPGHRRMAVRVCGGDGGGAGVVRAAAVRHRGAGDRHRRPSGRHQRHPRAGGGLHPAHRHGPYGHAGLHHPRDHAGKMRHHQAGLHGGELSRPAGGGARGDRRSVRGGRLRAGGAGRRRHSAPKGTRAGKPL